MVAHSFQPWSSDLTFWEANQFLHLCHLLFFLSLLGLNLTISLNQNGGYSNGAAPIGPTLLMTACGLNVGHTGATISPGPLYAEKMSSCHQWPVVDATAAAGSYLADSKTLVTLLRSLVTTEFMI